MANTNTLPPPPKGQKGFTLSEISKLPPPPSGQKGLTLEQLTASQPSPSLLSFIGSGPDQAINAVQSEAVAYGKRVADQYTNIASDILKGVESGGQTFLNADKSTVSGNLQATGGLLRSGLRATGGVAKAAFTPILEAPGVQQVVDTVAGGIMQIPGAKSLLSKGADLAEKNPQIARDIEDIFNILTLGTGSAAAKPIVAGAKVATKETGAVASDIAQAARLTLTPSEESIQTKVVSMFEKSIKPTPQKTVAMKDRYDSSILNALKTIKANSDKLNIEDATGELVTGRVPQSINELAQGLDQTKKIVFDQYDALAKQAGKSGATVDTKQIADELVRVSDSKALQLANPQIIEYAKQWEQRLRSFGSLDAETAQEVIKMMNGNLQAFYRNPTYETASKVTIDAGIVNNLRIALDKSIENATGSQYQALKNQYSALKAIENDVVRASLRDARRNVKGIIDYTDIFTGGQMIGGLLSLNPAMFSKGAVERGIKEYIKYLNDPNRAVSNMFEKLKVNPREEFVPTSATGKIIKNSTSGGQQKAAPKTQ